MKLLRGLLIACLLIGTSVVSYSSVDWVFNRNAVSADGKAQGEIIRVATVEEASRITGFVVGVPSFVPDGFVRDRDIVVSRTTIVSKNTPIMRTRQIWRNGEAVILLVQDRVTSGIGGGEKTTSLAVAGETELLQAASNRPETRVYFWKDGNMSYLLYGTLTGPLGEETIVTVAKSITAK